MFHIALTPNTCPANALSAKHETLMGAIAQLFSDCAVAYGPHEWWVANVLEAAKEAVDNLEDGSKPAKGTWSDMGMEDDAFSIDIFTDEDARYVLLDKDYLLAPHGAIALVNGILTTEWIYSESELAEWKEENELHPSDAVDILIPKPESKKFEYTQKTIESHNEPLRKAMFARGCEWKSNGSFECFTKDGKDQPYPVGYIRAHYTVDNNNPSPFSYSVQGPGGWLQKSFGITEEGKQWALETAASVLAADPTITEVIRDIKDGDCTLSAIFSDGAERKLFCFYIDELSFSDADLIGKTEMDAHNLHQQRMVAYLQA